MKLLTYGLTDSGLVRENNEDTYFIPATGSREPFALVADGMGGHKGGEIASATCRDAVCKAMRGGHARGLRGGELLRDAIAKGNRAVWDLSHRVASYRGMGTTLDIVYLEGNTWHLGHVGDSRVYLKRGDRIGQLTTDHSMVQELVGSGALTAEEAEHHPQKNLITKAIGLDEELEPDILHIDAHPQDTLLLCSDGLTDKLDAQDILAILMLPEPIEQLSQRLVSIANDRGGNDNITVVLVQAQDGPEVPTHD